MPRLAILPTLLQLLLALSACDASAAPPRHGLALVVDGEPRAELAPEELARPVDLLGKLGLAPDEVLRLLEAAAEALRDAGIGTEDVGVFVSQGENPLNCRSFLDDLRPKSVRTAVLVLKQGKQQVALRPDYIGCEIPDVFVVGYGLDYHDAYRNLPYLAALEAQDLERELK